MVITKATINHANAVARLIMQAMNYDCCRYFAGPDHTLSDFESVMTALVESEYSQYSYTNAIVALDDNGEVAGVCVSYDGKDLHRLREAFVSAARKAFGRDFSSMTDETQAGELYIDSIAVESRYRGKGIAGQLLDATKQKARQLGIPAVGLLVDKGNPDAERLYLRHGFEYVGDNTWGGHPMKHLQYKIV